MKNQQIDFEKLEDEDRQYMERILRLFPTWDRFVSMWLEDEIWRPEIRVESPAGKDRDLIFWSSDSDGPSWSFGAWHGHVEFFPYTTDEESLNFMARHVQLILIDRVLLLFKDDLDEFPNLIQSSELAAMSRDSFHKALSWSGRCDVI